ncbi:RraA family protein [Sphingobacterium paludis]|uniref:Regulator of RNase E activity RraA n=1 Tax=Sphingobacterium paludis TaxID=1476465 RepID=A0A4R7CRK1_9SPHI|nr:RraA family protein [Sphingobacterium paludis]TDS09767.1 regulator of RNase E activity RraA [Sphingobacterium paludis]
MFRFSRTLLCLTLCLGGQLRHHAVQAQVLPKAELTFLTSSWTGDRFEDGRPKIADDWINRARAIGLDDAWTILKNKGYNNQFVGGWKPLHADHPIVGRAVTATFMPSRPDVDQHIVTRGHENGRQGNSNTWPIEVLTKGDVYVADGFGKIAGGTLIGQTLGNAIFNKTGNGVVFDASVRDLEGLMEIKGFNAFVRDYHPSYLEESTLMGLNGPTRIGGAIVLPGDLVLAQREGVLFIPAHLVEHVVTRAEFILLRDKFGFEMIKNGKYNTGQIDNQWTTEIKSSFLKWLHENPADVKLTEKQLDEIMKDRTW